MLSISKAAPAAVNTSELITYTLTITNSGDLTATNLVITDAIPAGAVYISGGTKIGDMVSWTVPSLVGMGRTSQVSFVVTATETITNEAYGVQAEEGVSAKGGQTVTTFIAPAEKPPISKPNLTIHKTAPATARPDEPITYTLTITNLGDLTATNLVVTDIIPLNATYIEGGTKIGDVVSWTVPSLAANGGVTQTSFAVMTTQTITNHKYGVRADGGVGVVGSQPIVTHVSNPPVNPVSFFLIYLPVILSQ
jgi:uncharacterized repeat protein (TIGR01451 family)